MRRLKLNKNLLLTLFVAATAVLSCTKKEEVSDLDKLRKNNNVKTYPVTKMDSTQAITNITTQKVQELLDLSTLYTSGNGDTEIDSVIYAQMESYFAEPDSTKIKPILAQIDSLKAESAKVGKLSVNKQIRKKDTIDYATFDIEYFGKDKKSLGTFNRNASFVLKLNPVKFKKEFKFYFLNFDFKLPKDSTSSGVTR